MVRTFQFSSSAALRMMLGCSLWMLGFPDRGARMVESAVDLTSELQHYPSEAYALASALLLHYYQDDAVRAEQTADRLLMLAQQENFEIWSPFALMFRGWVMVEKGNEEGIALNRRGLDQWRATGSYLNQTIITAMLAASLRKIGRVAEALDVIGAEIADAERREELHFAPELHRLHGEMMLDQGLDREGEASLERGRQLAVNQGARMLELRAVTSLSRVWASTGRHDRAASSLSRLCTTFTEGFSTPDVRAARTLLGVLGDEGESLRDSGGVFPT
jgi:hypothetical protein